jgi:hypothetical protein
MKTWAVGAFLFLANKDVPLFGKVFLERYCNFYFNKLALEWQKFKINILIFITNLGIISFDGKRKRKSKIPNYLRLRKTSKKKGLW